MLQVSVDLVTNQLHGAESFVRSYQSLRLLKQNPAIESYPQIDEPTSPTHLTSILILSSPLRLGVSSYFLFGSSEQSYIRASYKPSYRPR
jgi:hypothetical protein